LPTGVRVLIVTRERDSAPEEGLVSHQFLWLVGVVGLCIPVTAAGAHAQDRTESRRIDVERSTLTVYVYKSGLFSAFADNHVIRAPIAGGSVSSAPLHVDLLVKTADLKVLDPDLAADKRAEIQSRMEGQEVLDTTKFPEITFASTRVDAAGANAERWTVTGQLAIHGQSRAITVTVARKDGRYQGEVTIRQRDFGIEPIKVAGGAVRVKDELKIQFDIAVVNERQ
jgi:hypothetical protein